MILFGRTQQAADTPFNPAVLGVLTSLETQAAIDELTVLLNAITRLVLLNTYNGTWSNNSFLGRAELLGNTPIKFARNTKVTELVFQNQNANKNFFLDLYKNGQAGGNLLATLTVNTGAGTGEAFTGLDYDFAAGDTLFYRYRNISGTSPSDSTIEIYCRITG